MQARVTHGSSHKLNSIYGDFVALTTTREVVPPSIFDLGLGTHNEEDYCNATVQKVTQALAI